MQKWIINHFLKIMMIDIKKSWSDDCTLFSNLYILYPKKGKKNRRKAKKNVKNKYWTIREKKLKEFSKAKHINYTGFFCVIFMAAIQSPFYHTPSITHRTGHSKENGNIFKIYSIMQPLKADNVERAYFAKKKKKTKKIWFNGRYVFLNVMGLENTWVFSMGNTVKYNYYPDVDQMIGVPQATLLTVFCVYIEHVMAVCMLERVYACGWMKNQFSSSLWVGELCENEFVFVFRNNRFLKQRKKKNKKKIRKRFVKIYLGYYNKRSVRCLKVGIFLSNLYITLFILWPFHVLWKAHTRSRNPNLNHKIPRYFV